MAGCPAGMVSSPGGGCVDPKESNQAGNNTTHRIQRRGGKMARGGRTNTAPARKMPHGGTAGGIGCKILTLIMVD